MVSDNSNRIILDPVFNSSPEFINTSLTIPDCSTGISIDAFSDSKTRIISLTLTVSPTETETSLTSAVSIPSPKSGRTISNNGFKSSSEFFSVIITSVSLPSLPSTSKEISTSSFFNSSPEFINTSLTIPDCSTGISIDAFSDSKTRIISLTLTVSPTETETSLTSAVSIPSPKSGSFISFIIVLHSYWVRFI